MITHVESVEKFIAASTWLTDEDLPAVTLLRSTAAQLDAEYNAAKANVFGACHRALLKKRPPAIEVRDADPAEEFLDSL